MSRRQSLTIVDVHAVEEMQVFLRAMGAAQRRWGKDVAHQENKVRRLMMAEDSCRDALKRNVLRATHKNLRYLVNTDLLTSAHDAPTPPPAETFLQYGVTPAQVSGFSVYAMSRLWADPERVDVPPLTLIADLQSTWAIMPPAKRDAYEQLAEIFRTHLAAAYSRREEEAAAAAAGGGRRKARAKLPSAAAAKPSAVRAARRRVAAAAAEAKKTPRRPRRQTAAAAAAVKEEEKEPPLPARLPAAWEAAAFDNFVKISYKQMTNAIRGGKRALSAKQWMPIAEAEWSTKTNRQKRSFVAE